MTWDELKKLMRGNPDLVVEGYEPPLATAEDKKPKVRVQRTFFTEQYLQASVIAECDIRAAQNPVWGKIYHTPNGGHRDPIVAKILQGQGVRRGVPDLLLIKRRRRQGEQWYSGLAIELKVGDNHLEPDQSEWLDYLNGEGFYTRVVWDDAEKAIKIIEWYIEGDTDTCEH